MSAAEGMQKDRRIRSLQVVFLTTKTMVFYIFNVSKTLTGLCLTLFQENQQYLYMLATILGILASIATIWMVLGPRLSRRMLETRIRRERIEALTRRHDLNVRMLYTGIVLDRIPVIVFRESITRKLLDLRTHIEMCKYTEVREEEKKFGVWYVGCLISFASFKGIEFEELAKIIIDSLGRDLSKVIVSPHVIMEHYGIEYVEEWRKLVN